jgi:hypothetical protein
MKQYNLKTIFHIENDVMIYEDLNEIERSIMPNKKTIFKSWSEVNLMWVVQDAPDRVIASIMFLPTIKTISHFNDYVIDSLNQNETFINDMNLLGRYPYKNKFPYNIEKENGGMEIYRGPIPFSNY